MPTSDLGQILLSAANEMSQEFENSLLATDPGTRGGAREGKLRELLERHLPQRYGVGTGKVLGPDGEQSQQCDVVIYDREFAPRFGLSGNLLLLPCESVYAVIEVKSNIRSRDVVEAAAKINSVKSILRHYGSQTSFLPGGHFSGVGTHASPPYRGEYLGALFACDMEPTPETLLATTCELIAGYGRHFGIDMVCVHNNGYIIPVNQDGKHQWLLDATHIQWISAGQASLGALYTWLVSCLQFILLPPVNPGRYVASLMDAASKSAPVSLHPPRDADRS